MSRVVVTSAKPDDLAAACRVLFGLRFTPDRERHAARCQALLTSGEIDPAGLFVARDERGEIGGAILVQPLPGALGVAWPPRAERAGIEDALVAAACDWLRGRGVKVCQAFAAEFERADMAPLLRHGFRRITQVVHLRREIDPEREVAFAGGQLDFHSDWTPEEFARTILATHDGSRDCPELNGPRTPGEIVRGQADAWVTELPRLGADPAGVVILDRGAEAGVVEVSYLGLTPAFRGRGLGDELVRHAIARSAGHDGTARLHLSVDARNTPALRLYRRHGFAEYDRREAYLATWTSSGVA